MKKNSIVVLVIVLIFLFLVNANAKKDFSFLAKECSIYIPSNYSIAVDENANMTFVPSIGADMTNSAVFTISFSKEPLSFIAKNQDINISKIDSIEHIKKINIKNNLGEFIFVIGKTFFINIKNINGDISQKFINHCNNTWHSSVQEFDKKHFLNHLKENLNISEEERAILAETISKLY